jgi:serine/threonine protein kinase
VLTTLLTAYNPFAAQPLGVRGLTNVTKQLLQAVAFLHDRGHVHCDIKPQNILYKPCPTEDGKLDIRLADFGSCIVATRDQNDYIVTRPYRPPEVMLGLPLSSAADVWSCGCVIMELILGAPLFTSNDHFQLVTAMVELLGVPNNHVIQRAQSSDTYFCRPRALTCPEAYDHPPIPPHATVKRSRNKRSTLYYHDADSNTSTFERPTLKAEDLPQVKGQLPSFDWQMRMSSTTGNWYYANAKLGATQWQRPIRQSLRSKVEATIGGYFQVSAFCHLFSVVEKMLVWDPDERITAREAAEQIS